MELSRSAMKITASATLEIDSKAKKMKADGIDVVGFGAGEPDFDTPSFIIDAAKKALDEGKTRYTPASGVLELKEAICNKFKKDNSLDYNSKQIIVCNGAKHALYNIFQAILNPGDEVIIPSPYWLSYPEMVKMAGGIPVFVETKKEDQFKVNYDDLTSVITSHTKAMILNSPNNPTGSVYKIDELKMIADLAVKNKFFVVSDEIYEEILYDGTKHISIASLNSQIKDQTLVVNGLSKSFAMTGWRIGYVAGREDIISVMSNIQSHSTSNPNSIAQYASITALKGPKESVKKAVSEFDKRRKYIYNRINSIVGLSTVMPKGAFYIMLDVSQLIGKNYKGKTITGSTSFSNLLLDAQNVAVVPGIAFGIDSAVRLSYATSTDNIIKGMDRIEAFVKELD
ncbi:MAG: pyridoxal phosphate-dependent aminotransferase [Xylanivirga thermophila]|jgi:aspartate aminotransferase|uniref:pyridoxal phosphate-dependent aminotransferase n=1 Tax=Xylanivirga thermophila TaxID=2496273 RepID=UPI0039F565EE